MFVSLDPINTIFKINHIILKAKVSFLQLAIRCRISCRTMKYIDGFYSMELHTHVE